MAKTSLKMNDIEVNEMVKNQEGELNHMYRKDIDTKKVIELYKEGQTIKDIAILFNCSNTPIRKRLIENNITLHSHKMIRHIVGEKLKKYRDINSKKGNRKNYIEIAKASKKWECERCKKTQTNENFDLIVHHKNGNNKDNEIDNLMILCQSCHSKIHLEMIGGSVWNYKR